CQTVLTVRLYLDGLMRTGLCVPVSTAGASRDYTTRGMRFKKRFFTNPSATPQDGGSASLFRTAGRAGGIMAGALLLSRVLGLLRDTVIAGKFGLMADNDSYRIATQIPDLIFMLIAGGGLSSAFIPVFSEFWYTDRRKEAWRV